MKLTQKVYEALNAQMVMEYEASGIYLQMGAWADSQDLSGCAAFLFEHTEEERMHGRKIFDYLLLYKNYITTSLLNPYTHPHTMNIRLYTPH